MSRNMYLHTFDTLLISFCYQNKINEWGGRGKEKEETKGKEKKNLPRPGIIQSSCELSGFEPGTFRSSVWRSPNWAISAATSEVVQI